MRRGKPQWHEREVIEYGYCCGCFRDAIVFRVSQWKYRCDACRKLEYSGIRTPTPEQIAERDRRGQ